MNVKLTPEQEQIVNRELQSGHFRTAEEVISKALQVLQGKEHSASNASTNGEHQRAVQEMLNFVEKNRTRLDGISVKQLIHEGHRL